MVSLFCYLPPMDTLPHIPQKFLDMFPDDTEHHMETVEGYTIHYAVRGQGVPVFMMHGNPTWSFLYRDVMALLDPTKYRCIVPDLVGLGYSSKPKKGSFHTLENHSRIMCKFLETQIQEPFIYVGQDWGGPIGLLAASRIGHEIRGMVIMNTMLRPPRLDFKPSAFHTFSRMPVVSDLAFRIFRPIQSQLHTVQGNPDSISGVVREAYMHPLRKFSENKAPLWLARMVPNNQDHPSIPFMRESQDFLNTYKGPVSLVWGKRDPILGRLASAHEQILPQAKTFLTGAGHFIQEEEAQLIAERITVI